MVYSAAMRRALLLGVGFLLTAGLVAPLAGEVDVPLEPRGLRVLAVSFYTASPVEMTDTSQVRIAYGNLDALVWDRTTLPHFSLQVLVLNTSTLRVPVVDVTVTVRVGMTTLDPPLPLDRIAVRGERIIQDDLHFERAFEVRDLDAGGLGVLEVRDLDLRGIVGEAVRQKMFPAYVHVEARLSEPTGEVTVIDAPASALLRLTPARGR